MHFGATHPDIVLAERVGDDVDVMTKVGERVRHLTDTCGRAVVGGKRASCDHRDGVTAVPAASTGTQVRHDAEELDTSARAVAGDACSGDVEWFDSGLEEFTG